MRSQNDDGMSMSVPMKPSDPAYWMLQEGLHDPSKRSKQEAPYRSRCYICRDPEFSLMGMPLCFACYVCGGHVAADDSVCDDCGHDHCPDDLSIRQGTTWADDGGIAFEDAWWTAECGSVLDPEPVVFP